MNNQGQIQLTFLGEPALVPEQILQMADGTEFYYGEFVTISVSYTFNAFYNRASNKKARKKPDWAKFGF